MEKSKHQPGKMLETAGDRTLRLNNKEAIFQTFWDCTDGDELAVLSQRSIDSDQQGVNKKIHHISNSG